MVGFLLAKTLVAILIIRREWSNLPVKVHDGGVLILFDELVNFVFSEGAIEDVLAVIELFE